MPGLHPVWAQPNGSPSSWVEVEPELTHPNDDAMDSKTPDLFYPRELLQETILNIIHAYYVDEHRATAEALLTQLLNELATRPSVGLKISKQLLAIYPHHNKKDRYQVHRHQLRTINDLTKALISLEGWALRNLSEDINQLREKLLTPPGNSEYLAGLFLIRLLLHSLDSHSDLMFPAEYRELRDGTEGKFGGLGMLVGVRDGMLTVIKPLPQSPAERLNIQAKDRIITIDGRQTYGKSLSELIKVMRGTPGTPVQLRILREQGTHIEELLVNREVVQVPSLECKDIKLKQGYAKYLKIESFSAKTSLEVGKMIAQMQAEKNTYAGLIMDLRDNPGGLLDQAIKVADLFLKRGMIVSTKGRLVEQENSHKDELEETTMPMVVIVNGDSASASEIVAGALKDHRRALVIGQPTFGKGSVQTLFELPDQMALKLTIARYRTPGGVPIQGYGIFPDVLIQPLFAHKENLNLFGSRRYLKEKFLKNYLKEKRKQHNFETLSPLPNSIHGTYLTKESYAFFGDKASDHELECALEILNSLQAYPHSPQHLAPRSTHWLGLAQHNLQKKFTHWNASVEHYLADEHHLHFSSIHKQSLRPLKKPQLKIEIPTPDSSIHHTAGERIRVQVKIYNPNQAPLPSFSLYWFSRGNKLAPQEKLFSGLAAQQTQSISLPFSVPSEWEDSSLVAHLGVNIFGFISYHSQQSLQLKVAKRQNAQMKVLTSFTDGKNSRVQGKIEPNERGFIHIYLQNTGTIALKDVQVEVINLSGTQFSFPEGSTQKNFDLGVGEHTSAQIAILAQHNIFNSQVFFGIKIKSSSLNQSILKQVVIHSFSETGYQYSRNQGFEK